MFFHLKDLCRPLSELGQKTCRQFQTFIKRRIEPGNSNLYFTNVLNSFLLLLKPASHSSAFYGKKMLQFVHNMQNSSVFIYNNRLEMTSIIYIKNKININKIDIHFDRALWSGRFLITWSDQNIHYGNPSKMTSVLSLLLKFGINHSQSTCQKWDRFLKDATTNKRQNFRSSMFGNSYFPSCVTNWAILSVVCYTSEENVRLNLAIASSGSTVYADTLQLKRLCAVYGHTASLKEHRLWFEVNSEMLPTHFNTPLNL